MAASLDDAFRQAHGYLTAAVEELETARHLADRGDHSGALTQIAMGLERRLEHAQVEITGVIETLRQLGGVYPPSST